MKKKIPNQIKNYEKAIIKHNLAIINVLLIDGELIQKLINFYRHYRLFESPSIYVNYDIDRIKHMKNEFEKHLKKAIDDKEKYSNEMEKLNKDIETAKNNIKTFEDYESLGNHLKINLELLKSQRQLIKILWWIHHDWESDFEYYLLINQKVLEKIELFKKWGKERREREREDRERELLDEIKKIRRKMGD